MNRITLARFCVLNSEADCLLSGDTAIDWGILKLNRVSNVTSQPNTPKSPRNTLSNTKSRPKRLRSLFSKYDIYSKELAKSLITKFIYTLIKLSNPPFKTLAEFRLP